MTKLLYELYETIKVEHSELFIEGTEATEKIEDMIEKVLPEKIRRDTIDLIQDLENQNRDMGFINGFRFCKRLMKELEETEKEDFLQDILIKDTDPYWNNISVPEEI